MASAGACGSSSIASSAMRAAATSAESSWLVAVTVKTLSRVRSTFTATTLEEARVIEFGPVEHDVDAHGSMLTWRAKVSAHLLDGWTIDWVTVKHARHGIARIGACIEGGSAR